MDNGPNIGRFGPAELEKEARWAAERAAAWERFQAAARWIVGQPSEERREQAFLRWQAQHGPASALSMRHYVAWWLAGKPRDANRY